MLKAISKAAFRVRSVDTAISTLKLAVQTALTAPAGPVSVEIPIDIQSALINLPADLSPLPVPVARPSEQALDDLAERFAQARRPMLWLGAVPGMPARRYNACWPWAWAWSPAPRGVASSRKTTRVPSAPST